MDAQPTELRPPLVSPAVANQELPITFTGNGKEYFGIWIVNLLLSIVTLGLYSPWAKVRRERYFYNHTFLDGSSFEYHGRPGAILKGRLIAFALLVLYNFSFQISPAFGAVVAVLLAAMFPWLLVSSLRFRLGNSSYRGLRFAFTGQVGQAYKVFLLYPILTLFSLYLLVPFTHQRIKRFQHDNIRFGSAQTTFSASGWNFYSIYFKTLGLVILLGIAVSLLFSGSVATLMAKKPVAKELAPFIVLAFFAAFMLFGLLISPFFRARMQNLIWNSTRLDDVSIRSAVKARRLLVLNITNLLGILLTLGLFRPFAVIRTLKYQLECKTVLTSANLDHFVAEQVQQASAIGEETADMFDLDLGL